MMELCEEQPHAARDPRSVCVCVCVCVCVFVLIPTPILHVHTLSASSVGEWRAVGYLIFSCRAVINWTLFH